MTTYYTPAEFSAALDSVLSKETIIRMCKSEEIKSVRRPAKYAHFKIPESELKRIKVESGIEVIENYTI